MEMVRRSFPCRAMAIHSAHLKVTTPHCDQPATASQTSSNGEPRHTGKQAHRIVYHTCHFSLTNNKLVSSLLFSSSVLALALAEQELAEV